MGLNNSLNNLKEILNKYFVNSEEEWVKISLEAGKRIDLIVVSEKTRDKKKSEDFINKEIKVLNEKENFDLLGGFFDFYTIDEAEIMEIKRPINREINIMSFGDIIDNTMNIKSNLNKSNEESKIISFYSYKGGVGRTVALIQSAYYLAKQGKKVALIDLDIEAPSFNSIFEEDIKSSNGILQYLFKKTYNLFDKTINDNKVIREDDFITSMVTKLNINTKGEMYVVPCGDLNIEYVKDLEILKEKIIYENNFIREFIEKIKKQYDIDYIFIDSRTGLNNWGALSIADLADEVFLIAYPNKENIKGINLILDLIQDTKKCTVIFSRIASSKEGEIIAKKLFRTLNISQEFIGIYYNEQIALTDKYPIESDIKSLNKISDFILEDEIRIKNREWIRNNQEKTCEILRKLSNDSNIKNIVMNNEKKIMDSSNLIIINDDNINIKNIINSLDNKANIEFINEKYINYLKKAINKIENYDIVNDTMRSISNFIIIFNENKELDEELFINRFFNNNYFRFNDSKEMEVNETIDNLKSIINLNNSYNNYEFIKFESIYEIFLNKVVKDDKEKFNSISNDIESRILIENEKMIIRTILLIFRIINLTPKIQVKLLVDFNFYTKNKKYFDEYNANTLNLSWKSGENSDRLLENISEIFNLTENMAYDDNEVSNIDPSILEALNIEKKKNKNLIYCKRIDYNKYSEELASWISKKIRDEKDLSKEFVLGLIKEAAKIEMFKKNNDKDSIITFESFNESINKIKLNK